MRQAEVYFYERLAGRLTEDETGYTFQYDADYLKTIRFDSVSTFPCNRRHFMTKCFFRFSTV